MRPLVTIYASIRKLEDIDNFLVEEVKEIDILEAGIDYTTMQLESHGITDIKTCSNGSIENYFCISTIDEFMIPTTGDIIQYFAIIKDITEPSLHRMFRYMNHKNIFTGK